ncbi:cupin domain-containing protein [Streptomyces sp. NBC_01136]|uniref:JmjC domain-containing protein n=1 Tax=unclassified Streptomyces TaxID=2593676 RepID=UPI00324C0243|nr:cupin domain-containing protein [Streptomyces sp. NBC_01136]
MTLRQWVGDVENFQTHYWRRAPAVFQPEGEALSPIGLSDVEDVLCSGLLRTPHVELTQAGTQIPEGDYTRVHTVLARENPGFADPAKIIAAIGSGATLLLRNVEQWHRSTADLCADLAAELGQRVEAFFFVTPPGGQGLAVHRDDADVLLIQVAGSKRWSVHGGPDNEQWQPQKVTGDPGPPLLSNRVHTGEVLYIPRAFAHSAVAEDEISAHLSLTIREVAESDLVRTALRHAMAGLPQAARPLSEERLLDSAARTLDHLRTRLDGLEPKDLLRAARDASLRRQTEPIPRLGIEAASRTAAFRPDTAGTPFPAE